MTMNNNTNNESSASKPRDFSWLPKGFIKGWPLPACVLGGSKDLSPKAREKIHQLIDPRPQYFIKALVITWATIIGIIYLAIHLNNIWFMILAIFIVATRQNILGLLIHEQSHCLGGKSKGGDVAANLFAGWPLLILSVEGYAKVHLSHHKYYFTKNDPGFLRKNGKEWTFPMKVKYFFWLCVTDFFGINLIKLFKGKNKDTGLIKENLGFPMNTYHKSMKYSGKKNSSKKKTYLKDMPPI